MLIHGISFICYQHLYYKIKMKYISNWHELNILCDRKGCLKLLYFLVISDIDHCKDFSWAWLKTIWELWLVQKRAACLSNRMGWGKCVFFTLTAKLLMKNQFAEWIGSKMYYLYSSRVLEFSVLLLLLVGPWVAPSFAPFRNTHKWANLGTSTKRHWVALFKLHHRILRSRTGQLLPHPFPKICS